MEMQKAFSAAEKKAKEEGRQEHGNALWLLSVSCFMMLEPSNTNEPYQPIWISGGRRSIIPEDFKESDIEFFASIVGQIDNHLLKARLADLVWTIQRSNKFPFALVAIDSYMELPLETETWKQDVGDCWERAIVLSKMLRTGAGDRLERLCNRSVELLMSNDELAYDLSRILKKHRLETENVEEIADRMEALGDKSQDQGNFHSSGDFFEASREWLNVAENQDRSIELTVKIAENWASHSKIQRQQIVASAYIEHAIKEFQKVPEVLRGRYKIDDRIQELRQEHRTSSRNALSEMGTIFTPTIDVTHIVRSAREEVKGKEVDQALLHFVNLSGIDVNELREDEIKKLREHPLLAIMPFQVVNNEGHIIGHRPGMDIQSDVDSEENNAIVESHMVQQHNLHIEFSTYASVIPAHEVLLSEHRLNESFFLTLARECPIVSPDRQFHFAKGLHYGYSQDYGVAMYILIPQIEHLIRFFLTHNGIDTTTFRPEGQRESALGALINKPESKDVLGDDLHFQIRALFCDQFGYNVRNNVAHGLFGDDAYHSPMSVYSWYFVFKIVFNTWYEYRQRSDT